MRRVRAIEAQKEKGRQAARLSRRQVRVSNIFDDLKLTGAEALDLFNRRHEQRIQAGEKRRPAAKLGAIWIPIALHHRVKLHCSREGLAMGKFVERSIKKAGVR